VIAYSNSSKSSSRQEKQPHNASAYNYSGETARVISSGGLNVRSGPSSNNQVLLSIPFNEIVGIINKDGESDTIDGVIAKWYYIDFKGANGWVWSKYLKSE
jgi:uncharacterized protein YgiM (DUF1202 family)